ncbi:PREDICTED: uncharacterized protein LOC109231756 [Nicotiana attenuata]|uniref:Uncharacterized protein n=1 Tax=Nicotiana attenuata TaxID=49451 RepID=A0A1J6I3H3_NICAT|nr:PREDICTED: uncharacterized protein LOC109231756 [Nicotiana attenuata]OIS99075.1 hypothetical protein A4A49_03662 [Nicotiana attenuata]
MQEEEFFCPSFSCYSSNRAAEIAAKISDEIKRDSKVAEQAEVEANVGEDDFEFSLVCENPEASVGEFLYDRQIQPVFPVFNRDLLLNGVSYDVDHKAGETSENANSSIQVSLKDLFLEDREPPSSSSSEVDELESVPPGTYCVWKPKLSEPSPSRCKKSNSTGSAFKRWSIRDLMRRSNSDGKDSFVFLTPGKGTKNETSKAKNSAEVSKAAGKSKKGSSNVGEKASSPAAVYLRNQAAAKEMDKNKRKSYLPYRQDLVGIFANVNSLGRTFPPF